MSNQSLEAEHPFSGLATKVNEVGKELPDSTAIEHLIFPSGRSNPGQPEWSALMQGLDPHEQVSVKASLARVSTELSGTTPATDRRPALRTVGQIRTAGTDTLLTVGRPVVPLTPDRATFLVAAFAKPKAS